MANYKNTSQRFGYVAQFFHWFVSVSIIGMLVVGFSMADMPVSPAKWQIYTLHKSFGLVLAFVITARLVWRWINIVPEVQGKGLLKILAKASVYVLYGLMFTMIISGFVMSEAGGYPIQFFGIANVPMILAKNDVLSHLAKEIHEITASCFVVILVTHVAAAFYHHFILKDSVLLRMLPEKK
ncbi:MAG: cytochrome b [Alphaproteobacteria bacterium]|nr:cytochrome b [Alphaproteobacteria bacterium]